MKYWDIEQQEVITEADLAEAWEALTESGEFDGTFPQYLSECLGKNGSLEPLAAHLMRA